MILINEMRSIAYIMITECYTIVMKFEDHNTKQEMAHSYVQSTLDILNSDISNSAKLEASF